MSILGLASPCLAEHVVKMAQHGAKMAQHSPKMAQHSPKLAPIWGQVGAKLAPSWTKNGCQKKNKKSAQQEVTERCGKRKIGILSSLKKRTEHCSPEIRMTPEHALRALRARWRIHLSTCLKRAEAPSIDFKIILDARGNCLGAKMA